MEFDYPLIKMLSGLGLFKNTVITVAITVLYTHYGANFAKIRIVQVMRFVCANSKSRFTEQEYQVFSDATCTLQFFFSSKSKESSWDGQVQVH
jgi:hypothetical protein